MTYGIRTFRANGSLAMDGSSKAGIFIEVFTVAASNASGNKVYSQIPAGCMYVVIGASRSSHDFTIDSDSSGRARLNWTRSSTFDGDTGLGSETTFLVFATRIIRTDYYGITAKNDVGDDLMDYTYPVPQYAETVQPSATPSANYPCPFDGVQYHAFEHKVTTSARSGTNRIVLINMPDSTSNDYWYAVEPSFIPAGSSSTTLTITVLKPSSTTKHAVPSLHIFSLDGPISGGGSYGIRYYKPNGALVYDSSAENISIKDLSQINYPSIGGEGVTKVLAVPAVAGISVPFYEHERFVAIDSNEGYTSTWRAIAQRKGSEVSYRIKLIRQQYDPIGTFTMNRGVLSGAFSIIVDISQLNPTTVTSTL